MSFEELQYRNETCIEPMGRHILTHTRTIITKTYSQRPDRHTWVVIHVSTCTTVGTVPPFHIWYYNKIVLL